MNAVTKNTQTFLETLQVSAGPEVQEWDMEALDRALGWANYCQEVHKKLAHNKPQFVDKLEKSLRIICSLPTASLSLSMFSFEDLAKSQRLLLKSLLQNPYLSSALYQRVLVEYSKVESKCTEGESKWSVLLEDATHCSQVKATRSTLLEMLQILDKSDQASNEDPKGKSADRIVMEIDAMILRQYLCHHLGKTPTPERTREYLKEKLHNIAIEQEEHGLCLIGTLLGLPSSDDSRTADLYKECDEFVFQWLMPNKHRPIYRPTAQIS